MTSTIAIKSYLEAQPNGKKVETSELMGLKKSCSEEEWDAMGKQAAENIGATWEPSPKRASN